MKSINISKIEKYIEKKVEEKFQELEQKRLNLNIKEAHILLSNYNKYKAKIDVLKLRIETLKEDGYNIIKKNNEDIKVQESLKYKDCLEIVQDQIEKIEKEIHQLNYLINKIDCGLVGIQNKRHYEIIELYYFKEKKSEEIIDILNISPTTYKRFKKELLNDLGFIMSV